MDDGVSATLNYVDPGSARNRLYVAKGGHMTTTRYAPQTVTIADGRPHAAEFGLDRSGFTLLAHESAVTDFADPRQLDTVYTAEVLGLLKRVTGADEAVSLGWVLRRSTEQGQELGGAQPPAPDVHVDIHPGRAHVRMEAVSPRPGERYKRAIVMSVWRAFSPPPQDWPLALLDYRSMSDDEGVVNLLLFVESLPDPGDVPDIEGPDAQPAGSVFEYRPGHRWWYFPSMRPDEVLLFKLHDSDHSVAWRSPHTAFHDTTAEAAGAHPRQSVELRSIAYFY
ncbi:MAG TPA: CmcJ/NvfI family oxidoreductase [Trebonia sp.]|nr:CmcJ/NvfI family oxidoreductase [Trebonia sp.]